MKGTVKKVDKQKGYGFITPEEGGNGKDLFFHSSGVADGNFDGINEGDHVTYDEGESPKGPKAINVAVSMDM